MGARNAAARSIPASAQTDAELVGRVLAGESEGYSTLVRRHQDALYRHALGMGLDHDTAQDLVQDAFVKAYASLDECRDPGSFRSWVFRILRNRCLDHLRSIRRRTVPLEALGREHGLHDAQSDRDELRRLLAGALSSLPDILREAFLLKHQAGYTYDELAEIADASPSAMKMRVHRAREALRLHLLKDDASGM